MASKLAMLNSSLEPAACACPLCSALSAPSAAAASTAAAPASATPPDPFTTMLDGGNHRWNLGTAMATPVTVTYSFMESLPRDNPCVTGFHAMTGEQQNAARSILSLCQADSGIRFLEVADAGSGGDIRMGASANCTGFAYVPGNPIGNISTTDGNLYIGSYFSGASMAPGGQGYFTLMHEIGHALGLRHPGAYNGLLPSSFAPDDTVANTVMSYNHTGFANPASFGPYDIAALRLLYGAPGAGTGIAQTWDAAAGTMRDDGTDGADVLIGINKADLMIGGGGSDLLIGRAGNDSMDGGLGNDSLSGGEGNDALTGGAGNDTLLGGEQYDRLDGGAGNDFLFGEGGCDSLSGGDGDDSLYGGMNEDTLSGGPGNDSLFGGPQNDRLVGGDGDDLLHGFQWLEIGRDGWNILIGGSGNDTLYGGNHHDFLAGGGDNDRLLGNAGNDTLQGDDGDDTMIGGAGNDTLWGGLGNDTYNAGPGRDAISDFRWRGEDHIRIAGGDAGFTPFANFDDMMQHASTVNRNTIIDFGGGNTLTLIGVSKSSLDAAYFIFG